MVGDGGTGERHYTQNTSSPYIGEVFTTRLYIHYNL